MAAPSFLGEDAKYCFRWIFGVFFSEKMVFFGEKSPERVPPDVFYTLPFKRLIGMFGATKLGQLFWAIRSLRFSIRAFATRILRTKKTGFCPSLYIFPENQVCTFGWQKPVSVLPQFSAFYMKNLFVRLENPSLLYG